MEKRFPNAGSICGCGRIRKPESRPMPAFRRPRILCEVLKILPDATFPPFSNQFGTEAPALVGQFYSNTLGNPDAQGFCGLASGIRGRIRKGEGMARIGTCRCRFDSLRSWESPVALPFGQSMSVLDAMGSCVSTFTQGFPTGSGRQRRAQPYPAVSWRFTECKSGGCLA
jgi:hypothetical protein